MHKYIVYIGNEGLEALIDVTDLEQRTVMATLAGTKTPVSPVVHELNNMSLRCRYNRQRDIGCWVIDVDIKYDAFAEMLSTNSALREKVCEVGIAIPI